MKRKKGEDDETFGDAFNEGGVSEFEDETIADDEADIYADEEEVDEEFDEDDADFDEDFEDEDGLDGVDEGFEDLVDDEEE